VLSALHNWLACTDSPRSADLIFVLAGRFSRKDYALALFRQRLAPRLLFSVARFEIRRFSKMPLPVPLDLLKLAQEVPPPQRHYFVFFEAQSVQVEHVPPRRFGTLTEIESLAAWLGKNPQIRSLLLVSSSTHLRRVRLCCRALLGPEIQYALCASPEPTEGADVEQDPATGSRATAVFSELFKLILYWILLKLRRTAPAPSASSV
jgi:uncharacterized SAM-binding protein YcdF (DUF218 family)